MLSADRTRLLERLWAEKPKLFVHGEGALCIDHSGLDGQEEAWPLSLEVLRWIVANLPDGAVTLETGCGYSTILFMICGARHAAIAPDYQQHGRIVGWCKENGVSCKDLRLINARSQDVIHSLDIEPLDLVLIDGCHAFPAPYIDWYYTAEKVKAGGFVIVDDCHLVTGKVLAEFLDAERGRWKLHCWIGKTAVFQKMVSEPVIEGYEWIDQPYCAKRVAAPSKRSVWGRVRNGMRDFGRFLRPRK
jgi:hypothetical protein